MLHLEKIVSAHGLRILQQADVILTGIVPILFPGGGGGDVPMDCTFMCSVSISEITACTGNSQIIKTTATTTSPNCLSTLAPVEFLNKCKDGSEVAFCGNTEASLPFFGIWQLIASLVSIAFVYALLGRKRLF